MHKCGSEIFQIWLQHDHKNSQFLNIVFTYGQQTLSAVTIHVCFSNLDYGLHCRGTVVSRGRCHKLNSHHVGVASMALVYGKKCGIWKEMLLVIC